MRIVLLFVLLAATGMARGETIATCNGFVDTLPATITTGGTWCLDHDVATTMASGAAITVAAHNVTLDCNGFKIGGLGAGPSTATSGIQASQRLNVVVRNCNVRGFRFGIAVLAGGGHLIEGNRIESSTLAGIFLTGPAVVRDNRVFDTANASSTAVGIGASGATDVIGNTISGVSTSLSGGTAYGVALSANPGSLVDRNTVRGIASNAGIVYGLWMSSDSDRVLFRDNDLMGRAAETTGTGIFCQAGESNALLHGNSMLYFPDAWGGCVDAGRNVELLP